MLAVSQAWKDLQQQAFIDKNAIVELEMRIYDPSQYETAVSSNDKLAICVPHDIIGQDYDIVRNATLEQNFWLLDDSREILADKTTQIANTGYISNSTDQETTINIFGFDTYYTTKQFSIEFGEYNTAKSFSVIFKNSDGIIEQIDISDNTDIDFKYVHTQDISGYSEIDIVIHELAIPNQRARIKKVIIGVRKTFTPKDIISYKMSSSVALINDGLPQNEIDFEIDNTDDIFNPDNEDSLFTYLSKRQEIIVRYGYELENGTEYINGGTFYLTEWDTPQNSLTATFKGKNALSFFTKLFYNGKNESKSLYALAYEVFEVMGWDTDYVNIESSLDNIFTSAPMPKCTCAEALQLIAQAGNCALYIDSNNKICIKPIDLNTIHHDYEINNFNEYEYPELEIDDQISYFNVAVNHYYQGENGEIFKGTLEAGTNVVVFSNLADYTTISTESSVATLSDPTSIKCTCVVETSGEITITGNKLENSESVLTIDNESDGDELDIANELIDSIDRARAVGSYIQDMTDIRYTDNCNFRIDPRLELLDIVPVQGKLATNHCIVKEISISYNGAFKGTCKAKRLGANY